MNICPLLPQPPEQQEELRATTLAADLNPNHLWTCPRAWRRPRCIAWSRPWSRSGQSCGTGRWLDACRSTHRSACPRSSHWNGLKHTTRVQNCGTSQWLNALLIPLFTDPHVLAHPTAMGWNTQPGAQSCITGQWLNVLLAIVFTDPHVLLK